MRKSKKVSLLLATVAAIAMLTACGSGDDSGKPRVDNTGVERLEERPSLERSGPAEPDHALAQPPIERQAPKDSRKKQ
jgi:hypothetical protein